MSASFGKRFFFGGRLMVEVRNARPVTGLQQGCNDMRFPCASCEIGIAIMRKIMSKIMRITANAASDNAFVQHAAIIV
ncbi:hypothetical protein [Cupriavidus sp. YR651]|uniref:hypothetical protein n=1 Tax=Cupriavidus sp. YR651 TaxID=1855315 RepID=UPI000B861491|nr:hypothetical protein [Cupriavidus sp. YR651]